MKTAIRPDYVRRVDPPAPLRARLTLAGIFWLGYAAFVTGCLASLYFGGVVLAAAKRAGAIIDLQQLVTTCALIGVVAALCAIYWSATGGECRD